MPGSATSSTTVPRWRRWGVWRVIVAIVIVGVAVVVVLPDLIGLDGRQFFAFFVALRPQVAAVVTVVAIVLLVTWRSRWPEFVAVLVVCAIAAAIVVPRAIPHPIAAASSGDRTLKVLSFNVDQGGADVARLAATIRSDRPDVVVLPESADAFRTKLADAIPGLGYRSAVAAASSSTPDVHGVTVFTAPSLGDVDTKVIDEGVFDPWLQLSGGRLGSVRVLAVHVSAPTPGKIEDWPKELASLQTWCRAGAGPVVIAGDFNATLDHSQLRAGIHGCLDAGTMTGKGLVATWPTKLPKWFGGQIDHVLGGGGATPTSLQILDLPGSDHRALLATVRVP